MKRSRALLVALGMAAVFASATLAGADCAYHKSQASIDKTTSTKQVASVSTTDKTDTEALKTARVTKPAQSAAEMKN